MDRDEIKDKIKELVDRYKELERAKSRKEMGEVSEANVRGDFIDPLFEALGWNTKDPDEYDRENYVQDVGYADIALKMGKEPVIFVEAKRFGAIEDVSKRGEADWMDAERQVMNYALGKGIKWAVLTNFEKFRLFNAFNGFTILDIKAYWEYEERLDGLLYLTRDSVETGHIDRLERREEKPDVDYKFLKSLNRWRLKLANDIYHNNYANEKEYKRELQKAIRSYEKLSDPRLKKFKLEVANKKLTEVDYSLLKDDDGNLRLDLLKSTVQRTLDRLVIVRYAEDKLIMDNPDQLRALCETWQSTKRYTSLFGLLKGFFVGFNEIHDSSIFEEGHICEKVKISDELIGEIINEMYEVNFRKFDFDILGNTYESYLGHTLNISEDGKVDLVLSQETRKESGIYYTPPYVVDYIVKNTVGELLKEKTPEEIKKIKVLDPACGSGSFLIKAYDYFENYYKEENERIAKEKRRKVKEFLKNNKNQITFEDEDLINFEKHTGYEADILQNNIFGVDLDEQAAEIASVNLVLKAIRRREMLPLILGHTVMVGNSLISGTEEELRGYFGEDWQEKKPFNWEEEFAQAMGDDGFDVVIGNPPYINVANLIEDERKFLMKHYRSAIKRLDIYISFIERGIDLLKNGGKLSFIIPYPFLNQNYAEKLRKIILDNCLVEEIVDLSIFKIFSDATVRNVILILKKERDEAIRNKNRIKVTTQEKDPSQEGKISGNIFYIPQQVFHHTPEYMFRLELNEKTIPIIEKIDSNSINLGKILVVSWGARGVPVSDFHLDKPINDLCKRMVKGENIGRYCLNYTGKWLLYDVSKLYRPSFPQFFDNEKIIISKVTGVTGLIATYDNKKYYTDDSLNCGILKYHLKNIDSTTLRRHKLYVNDEDAKISKNYDLQYLLALINSKLTNFYFKTLLGYELNVYPESIEQLPIHPIDFSNSLEKTAHDDLITLADRMLSLNRQLNEINIDFDHYVNLSPREKDVTLEIYLKGLPPANITVGKDGSGKSASQIEEKVKKFEIREEGENLIFEVGYEKGSNNSVFITIDALTCKIPDENLRKFLYYSLKEYVTPGKVGKGKIYERLLKIKIPCFDLSPKKNKEIINKLMGTYLPEVKKYNELKMKIDETDKEIDSKVYELYGLTEEEIKIVEESLRKGEV